MRVPFCCREKAAYAKLRRQGLSVNQLARFFGRSTSVISRALNRLALVVPHFDLRKSPHKARLRISSFLWAKLTKLRQAWEAWICGEGDRPP